MTCMDLDSLQARYKKAVDNYVIAAKKLRDHARDIPQSEFILLWHASEYARNKCAKAHRLLQQHISGHDCTPNRSAQSVR